MCSIMGYCDCCAAFSDFEEGFKKTVSRGPDDSRIIDTGKGLLGFHRLAIMGLTPDGMQPFELDGSYVVCNGEIYGYEKIKEELAKKYTFKSGSDCEILLPLYREYGVDMFKMLEGDYLPHDILFREKAAFSDAVGHSMVDYLKEYAEGLYTEEEFKEKCEKYTHAKPFTKESLLYREIFEKYYPGQSEMIVDFWMPNKSWEGCDVNDPSARVLSNYGESGK